MKKTKSLNIPVSDRETLLEFTDRMATPWTHSAAELSHLAELAEKRLDKMEMPKGKRQGVIATHTSIGCAHVEQYGGIGSEVTLRRARDGWYVVGYQRVSLLPRQNGHLFLLISHQQHRAAVQAMRVACGVMVQHA